MHIAQPCQYSSLLSNAIECWLTLPLRAVFRRACIYSCRAGLVLAHVLRCQVSWWGEDDRRKPFVWEKPSTRLYDYHYEVSGLYYQVTSTTTRSNQRLLQQDSLGGKATCHRGKNRFWREAEQRPETRRWPLPFCMVIFNYLMTFSKELCYQDLLIFFGWDVPRELNMIKLMYILVQH